jgi:CCAAT/enhancer binding protein (C/EBP) gamma
MGSKKKGSDLDKYSEEYREKRMKNNVAVKRSRDKSKAKAREAQGRVQQLQAENEQLQGTVDAMTSELRYLKEMLISQAGTDSAGLSLLRISSTFIIPNNRRR